MAKLTSKDELKEYCLRRLGKPVIDINISDEQLEDRVQDAIEFFQDYHFAGTQRTYLKHLVTDTDVTNKYIDLSASNPNIVSIVRLFIVQTGGSSIFNVQYQTLLNQMYSIGSIDLMHYNILGSYLTLIQQMLTPEKALRFNRYENKIYIDTNWQINIHPGDYIVFDVWSNVDPESVTRLYNDRFLKLYTTALIKRQWGENLKKYGGIALLGGVTLNGQALYDEAVKELQDIESTVQTTYVEPPEGIIG